MLKLSVKVHIPYNSAPLHLKKILDTAHDYVILGPAKALHIYGHDLGPDAAEKESIVVTIVLSSSTLVGPHGLRLPGVDLTHHSSAMRQVPNKSLYSQDAMRCLSIVHMGYGHQMREWFIDFIGYDSDSHNILFWSLCINYRKCLGIREPTFLLKQ